MTATNDARGDNAAPAGPQPSESDQTANGGAAAKGTPAQTATRFPSGPRRFSDLVPWAVTPLFLTIAICWLARLQAWPALRGASSGFLDRILDGVALTLVMLLAQSTAFALHLAIGTSFAPFLQKSIEDAGVAAFLLRPSPALFLAFFIGALVVRDVRLAAHAQLTDPRALSELLASNEAAAQGAVAKQSDPAKERPETDVPPAFGPISALPRSG